MPTDGDDEVRASAASPASHSETPAHVDPTGAIATPEDALASKIVDVPAGTDPQTFAAQLSAAADARQLLWPWVARRTRPQITALILISCLALGPAFALFTILRADPTPVNQLVTAPPTGADVTRITVTAIRLSPTAGEIDTRISIVPGTDLREEGTDKLKRPVTVTVNGSQGTNLRTFAAGEIPASFEASLPLSEGTTNRYPFDRYRGSTVVVVTVDPDDKRETSPSVIEARSIVADFTLAGSTPATVDPAGQSISAVSWTATRPATTTVYAVWLMILMWGLAVIGLLIVWAVVIWMIDLPFWAVGYLVGVLFALPKLRDSLPGRPPPGTIFDFVSFYWSITITGVGLILLLAVWLLRVRGETRLRSLDAHRDA